MTKLVKTLEIVVPTWMIVKGCPDTPGSGSLRDGCSPTRATDMVRKGGGG